MELGGPSETKRLKEPCLLGVALRGPPRQKIQDPTNDQNRPRYAQIHAHGTDREPGGSTKPGRLRDPGTRRHKRDRDIESTERPPRQRVPDLRYAQGRHPPKGYARSQIQCGRANELPTRREKSPWEEEPNFTA